MNLPRPCAPSIMSARAVWGIVAIAVLLGGFLRFVAISAWGFENDEIASLALATGHDWNDAISNETIPKTSFYRSLTSLDGGYFSKRVVSLLKSDTQTLLYFVVLNLVLHLLGTTEA